MVSAQTDPARERGAALLPVLVIVAAHSRFITGRMLPTRQTPDLLLGTWSLLQDLGRVPSWAPGV